MAALDNRPDGDPVAPEASKFGVKVPLVRVVVPHAGHLRHHIELMDVFRLGLVMANHKSPRSREVEERLGAPDSIYFHAGRAHPDYGKAILVFKDLPGGVPQEATPFGLGGLLCEGPTASMHVNHQCIAPIAHRTDSEQATFYRDSNWRSDWRPRTAAFMNSYFRGRWSAYFDDASGKPLVADPDGIYTAPENTDWRAWTVEVRATTDSLTLGPLIDADRLLWWAIDDDFASDIEKDVLAGRSIKDNYPFYARLLAKSDRRVQSPDGNIFASMKQLLREACL